MKKTLVAITAVALASAAALPAAAQSYGRWNGYNNTNARQQELLTRIQIGQYRGAITVNEANRLRYDLRQTEILQQNFQRNDGRITNYEKAQLDRRLDAVSARISWQTRDADRRYGQPYGRR
jgi:hypothetical protein